MDGELVGYGLGVKTTLKGPSGLRAGSICNWGNGCSECGAGLEIVGPLYLQSSELLNRKTPVCDTEDWIIIVHGDIFRHALELDSLANTSFGEVRDAKTKRLIDWYHVKPQFELPLPNIKKSKLRPLSTKYDEICKTCGRTAYSGASSKTTYYDRKTWPNNLPVVAKSWEHYGMWSRSMVAAHESIGARPFIIVNAIMGEWLRTKYGKRWFVLIDVRLPDK